MSRRIVFRRVARNEFDQAADWYEQRRVGRGINFSTAVRDVLALISEQPHLYTCVFDDLREASVPGYPYCVYYQVADERILIVAVFHTARDPAIWQSRI